SIQQRLLPMQTALPHMPAHTLPEVLERRVDNGRELTIKRVIPGAEVGDLVRIENRTGQLLALYRVTEIANGETHTKPEKVFKE
ncbi:MAG: hypothetical protein ACXVDJ_05195, partial [Tumebacillaceae bacterium]